MTGGPGVAIAMFVFFVCEGYLPVALRQMTTLDHTPFLKMSWRAQTSVLLLMPIALVEARLQGGAGWSQYTQTATSTLALFGGLFSVGASWVCSFSLLSTSLKMTSLAHATLCAVGMPPIFLTLYSIVVKREKPVPLELVGVVLAVGGIAIAVQDAGDGVVTIAGDVVATGSALASASFGLCISHVRSSAPAVPIFNFQFAWSACALPIALLLPLLLGETDLGLSDEPIDGHYAGGPGLFDWATGAYWPQMLFLAIGMGIVCQASIAYIVQAVGPLPYGLVMCSCPAGSALMGYLCGNAPLPGMATVIGGTIVLIGLAIVLIGNDSREKQANLTLTPALSGRGRGSDKAAGFSDGAFAYSASPSGETAAAFLIHGDEPDIAPPGDASTARYRAFDA